MYVYMLHPETKQELLWFSPNYGVTVKPALLQESAEKVKSLLQTAMNYNANEYLRDCCQGGRGPLMKKFGFMAPVPFEAFLEELEQIRITEETMRAKRSIVSRRRSKFQNERARLALKLIDSGMAYVCAWPECKVTDDLTIDHIEPLSRGGSDDLANLQFLCRAHNSQKGDRVMIGVTA